MAKGNIAEQVTALLTPKINEMGYDVWDVEYKKEGADFHLIITIDKPEGIYIEDCEAVHRAIDPILDEADPIEGMYYLDVSSPGIERDLRTDKHILASIGEVCEAKLFAPLNGAKAYKGTLISYEDGILKLGCATGEVDIPRESISKLKTVYFD